MTKLSFDPDKLNLKDKALYETIVAKRKSQGAHFGGPYAALMNHPELCEKVEALGYYLKFQGHLPRDVYQFVVLCVAKETKADFEWSDHAEHALAAGVPAMVIKTIKSDGYAGDFQDPYCAAAHVLVSTFVWKSIPEQVQNDAIKKYGIYGFIEVVVLSGFYQMFAAINEGFDV